MSKSILRGIRPKEVQDLVRSKLREGWTLSVTGSNHIKLTHPNGRSVVTAADRFRWAGRYSWLGAQHQGDRGGPSDGVGPSVPRMILMASGTVNSPIISRPTAIAPIRGQSSVTPNITRTTPAMNDKVRRNASTPLGPR